MKQNLSHMTDDEITQNFRESVRQAIQENREKGLPVCGYDMEQKKSYILYPDGRKEYAKD